MAKTQNQGGFTVAKGRNMPILTPAVSMMADVIPDVLSTDNFLSNFNNESDYQGFSNYQMGKTMEKSIGKNPFLQYDDFKAIFDKDAKPVSEDDYSDPTQKAMAGIYNRLVKFKGHIPEPDFMRKTLGHSMTAGWVKFLTGEDVTDLMGGFAFSDKGVKYKGEDLELTQDEQDLFAKYVNRVSGEDADKSFVEKVGETAVSLAWDLPLMTLTGGIVGKGLQGLGTVGEGLMFANKGFGRYLGNVVQQTANFNLLGLPQTVEAITDDSFGAGLDSILHSTLMGTLAATTTGMGQVLFGGKKIPIIKEILKSKPALREELAGLGGGFGFGYLSGKFAGQEDVDALAQGLGFAATHFTNPRAYKRILMEQKNSGVRIRFEAPEAGDKRINGDYFIEKDGMLHKIDADAFNNYGKIRPLEGYKPMKLDAKAEVLFPLYNEVMNGHTMTFSEALTRARRTKRKEAWLKENLSKLPKDYVANNKAELEMFAEVITTAMETEKLNRVFASWKMPEDAKLHDTFVKLSDNYGLKYSDVKRHVMTNVKEFLKDREGFTARFLQQEVFGKDVTKDILDAVEQTANLLAENVESRLQREVVTETLERSVGTSLTSTRKTTPREPLQIEDKVKGLLTQGQESLGNRGNLIEGVQTKDPKSRAVVNEVEKQIKPLLEGSKRRKIDEKIVTDRINDVQNKFELDRLGKIYEDVLKHNENVNKLRASKQRMKRLKELKEEHDANSPNLAVLEDLINKMKKLDSETETLSGDKKTPSASEEVKTVATDKKVELAKVEKPKVETKSKEIKDVKAPAESKDIAPTEPSPKIKSEDKKVETKETKAPETREEFDQALKETRTELEKLNPGKSELQISEALFANNLKGLKKGSEELVKKYHELDVKKHELAPTKVLEKDAIDVSNVAIKSSRIKNLIEAGKGIDFVPKRDMKIDKDLANQIEKAATTSNSITDFAKRMNFDKNLKFLWDIADKLGIELKYQETNNIGEWKDNSIILDKVFWSEKHPLGVEMRMGLQMKGDKKLLEKVMVHELIHGMLESPNLKISKEQSAYIAKMKSDLADIRDNIRSHWAQDLIGNTTQMPANIMKMFDDALNRNASEIVTMGLTEPIIARYLDALPASPNFKPAENVKPTVWQQLKERIKTFYQEIVGLTKGSQLDEIVQTLDKLFEEEGVTFGEEKIPTVNETRSEAETSNIPIVQPTKQSKKPPVDTNNRDKTNESINRRYGDDFARKFAETYRDNRDAGERDRERPEEEYTFNELNAERMQRDTRETREARVAPTGREAWDQVKNNSKIIDFNSKFIEYANLNLPPIFYAEMSDKFRTAVYIDGEGVIRSIPRNVNNILLDKDGWFGGRKLTQLLYGKNRLTRNPFKTDQITPEGQAFLDAFKTYEYGRRTGKIEEEMTWNEFADWANFNARQKEVLEAQRIAQQQAIDIMKEKKYDFIMEHDENPASGLTKMQVEDILQRKVEKGDLAEARTELNRLSRSDAEIKSRIAESILEKAYRGWGETVYYNSVRPTDPNTWLAEAYKETGEMRTVTDKDGNETQVPVRERISTYFESEKEAMEWKATQEANGWNVPELHQIKKLIETADHWNKLNAHQLMELANQGHIPLDNEIIKRLLDATKTGVDTHTIKKEYIEGMKYTAKEFENQLERFVRESVYGGYKAYHLTSIDRNLKEWQAEINPIIKANSSSKEALAAKREFEYATRYFNQLKQSERTWIDELRGATISFQVGGIKPAFLFQQAMQVAQTTFSSAMAETLKDRGTVGDAIKTFGSSFGNAFMATIQLNKDLAGRLNPNTPGMIPQETLNRLAELHKMNKIGGQGIAELTAEVGELEHKYEDSSLRKGWNTAVKGLNVTGKAVEQWSRVVTALTYEEIGKRRGLEGEDLINFMADGVDKNMAEWGKGGRAPLLDPKVSKTADAPLINGMKKAFMTYKTFAFYNYGLWRSMYHNKQWGAMGTKAIVGAGMHGITKFPLFASLFALVDAFTDEDIDYTTYKYAQGIDDAIPGLGSILHKGVGGLAGLDFRETFGEDTPLATDLFAEAWAQTWNGKVVETIGGAPYGFVKDGVGGMDAARQLLWDYVTDNKLVSEDEKEMQYNRLLKLSPVFIRNIFNSMKLDEDGIEVRGKQIVTREDMTFNDILAKALSFPISKQTDAYTLYAGGPEQQYNEAKNILKAGATHRKEFGAHLRKQGYKGKEFDLIMKEEMKSVANDMNEAREVIRRLEREVKEIKRKRKLNK